MADSVLDLTRQSGIVPTERVSEAHIVIVGAGAIGSHVAEVLAKLGIRELTVYDDDTIEKHNLPNQGYGIPDLEKLKVEALKERLERSYGCVVNAISDKVTEETQLPAEIVIAAVDSMSARKTVLAACNESDEPILMIDPRMGAQYGVIHTVDLLDVEVSMAYELTLIPDSETYQVPCTEKATIFCAMGMAAFIGSVVAQVIRDEEAPKFVEMDFARLEVSTTAA